MRRDAQVSLQSAEVLARKGERKKERALGVGIMPRLRVRLLLLLSLPLSLLSLSLTHWADSNSGDALSAPQSGLAGAPQELAHCPLGVELHASSTTCGETSTARRPHSGSPRSKEFGAQGATTGRFRPPQRGLKRQYVGCMKPVTGWLLSQHRTHACVAISPTAELEDV